MLNQALASPLLIQLPDNSLGKATENDPHVQVPVNHMGNLEKTPISWLLPDLYKAVAAICGSEPEDGRSILPNDAF